ncbi:MAG: bacteriohemerythrin [Oscillospiraceae bacterium]|jgi:hemerythrin|nr:bacteriohemerythrin [Oscillospiraceae bacterium]
MAYVWTEELATGNLMIDSQHKQLVKMVNDLMEACKGGQGRAKLSPIMQFLIDYTVKHFADEEKLQQQHGYPDFLSHRKMHEAFKVTVLDLDKQLKAEGATIALVAKMNTSIGGWLVNHIQREDKKVAAHIK